MSANEIANRPKSDVAYESTYVMRLSAWQHAEDVRHYEPRPFYGRKKTEDTRSDKSKAFSKHWIG